MNDNKNAPAFPVMDTENIASQFALRLVDQGMSKREYFACNAPIDIPEWFKHAPIEWEEVLPPQLTSITNEDLKQQAIAWIRDPVYDLPQELDWFQDAYEMFWDSKRRFAIAEEQARYFQWRKYYAEQLLLTLSNP